MAQFLLLHCPYRPETYSGHRIESITADDMEAAKAEAARILEARWNSIEWEYRLVQLADDSGYRLHNQDKASESWLCGGRY